MNSPGSNDTKTMDGNLKQVYADGDKKSKKKFKKLRKTLGCSCED